MEDLVKPRSDGRPRRILMMTNADRGQANVFLAASSALYDLDPDVEIHFATLPGLEADFDDVLRLARAKNPGAKPIAYHQIDGLTMAEGIVGIYRRREGRDDLSIEDVWAHLMLPPGLANTPQLIEAATAVFFPYTGPEMLRMVRSVEAILGSVEADFIVVDALLTAAITALLHIGREFAVLAPNAIKDLSPRQPGLADVLKFPCLYSGFTYPVPWYQVPLNLYYVYTRISCFLNSAGRKEVTAYLKEEADLDVKTIISLATQPPPWLKLYVSSLAEIDFPIVKPDNVVACGPILRMAPPVEESDPEITAWLARSPTIYINLGSQLRVAENHACEMAKALKIVLAKAKLEGGYQVLWKLKKLGEYDVLEPGSKIREILGEEIDADRVRIVSWVKAEPISVLRSGHVACSIHHGGANSYNEAIIAAVPHVVLPPWTDCYEYANRVETLGVGRWASKAACPFWTSGELSAGILDVLQGPNSASMREKAKELAAVCEKHGDGADNAARMFLRRCDESIEKGSSGGSEKVEVKDNAKGGEEAEIVKAEPETAAAAMIAVDPVV